jgi:hypothetical protein
MGEAVAMVAISGKSADFHLWTLRSNSSFAMHMICQPLSQVSRCLLKYSRYMISDVVACSWLGVVLHLFMWLKICSTLGSMNMVTLK